MHHRTSSFFARALTLGLTAGLVLLPTSGRAAPNAGATDEAAAATPEGEPPAPAAATASTEASPQPEVQPQPEPQPKPVVSPPRPAPEDLSDGSLPDPTKARRLRVGGVYTLLAGSVVALAGVGLGIGFTIKGKRLDDDRRAIEDALFLDDCAMSDTSACRAYRADFADAQSKIDAANTSARVGGILVLAGAVVIIAGGVAHREGVRMEERLREARIRVAPSLGGAVISGRF
ncbi:hypothetical protein OEB96_13390 [Paraliomyxa miuraensis]|nr:hypothetical protein [Paraliomyxa miuraensis]